MEIPLKQSNAIWMSFLQDRYTLNFWTWSQVRCIDVNHCYIVNVAPPVIGQMRWRLDVRRPVSPVRVNMAQPARKPGDSTHATVWTPGHTWAPTVSRVSTTRQNLGKSVGTHDEHLVTLGSNCQQTLSVKTWYVPMMNTWDTPVHREGTLAGGHQPSTE